MNSYLLYNVVAVGLAAFSVLALALAVIKTQFPTKPILRVRIVSEFSRGAWFPMGEREMLRGVVAEMNTSHGPGKYWLEYK